MKAILFLLLSVTSVQALEQYPVGVYTQSQLGNSITLVQRDTREVVKGVMIPYDLTRTFDSGSCIASGGVLIKQGTVFYCYDPQYQTLERME